MRIAMARPAMHLGQVHVVVVVAAAPLRAALARWLGANKRVRIVRAIGSEAELGEHHVDCDLVVASALEGPRELRALAKRFGARAGLVAVSLGTAELPPPWSPFLPGAGHRAVLERAMAHPERTLARGATALSLLAAAVAAVAAAPLYVPALGVSFQRAALAYAARFPEASTWWHSFGAGGPFLAAPAWPLIKATTLLGGGPESFVLLSAMGAALFAASFLLLLIRIGAARAVLPATLALVAMPAVWVWPRGGDLSSLIGLSGALLAVAGSGAGRLRFVTTAVAVLASALGGAGWVVASALVATVLGIHARRARASLAGALLGAAASAAIVAPPLLERGLQGLRPPLARPVALSDLAPVFAVAAVALALGSRARLRLASMAIAAIVLAGANALALLVPAPPSPAIAIARGSGPMGRLAVYPDQALAYAVRYPDTVTTGHDVSRALMLGELDKAETNARLEWLGADRAVLPTRSAGLVFNERDWSVLDREKLLLAAPSVRPVLTAGITPTLLVVAEDAEAAVFGDALAKLGVTSDRMIDVRAGRLLDDLDRDTLRQFTVLVVYGQPWRDLAKAQAVLEEYLALSGFLFMDPAARPGREPLVGESRTVRLGQGDAAAKGSTDLVPATAAFTGDAVSVAPFAYRGDPGWEQAGLAVTNQRVLQYGQTKIAGDVGVSTHMVWSGLDLPRRAAAGEAAAVRQLGTALRWMLGAAQVTPTSGYGLPSGEVLDNPISTSTFLGPEHWRIELKAAATGVLFKERWNPQWRAYLVDRSVSGLDQRTPLTPLRRTTQGFIYASLPPNARVVDFVFQPHPLEAATRGVSAVALAALAGISLFIYRRRS